MSHPHAHRTKFVRRMMGAAAVVAAAMLSSTLIAAAPASAAEAHTGAGIAVNGHLVTKVQFHGRAMSYTAFERLTHDAATRGESGQLVIDPSAVERGYFLAFSAGEAQQADAYLVAHNMPRSTTPETASMPHQTPPQVSGGTFSPMTGCNGGLYYAYYYSGLNCGGSYLSATPGTIIYHLSDYGWNDQIYSLVAGVCITATYLYTDANLLGYKDTFGGGGQAYGALPHGGSYSSLTVSSARNC